MPGDEGRSANPVDSVRRREKARSAARKHQKNRSSLSAARACAARLMAPGAALAIPRLSRGCLDSFCPAGDRKSFLLARTLLQAGIGDAQDWQVSHGDPVQFMARTIERAAERFDKRTIDAVAHIHVSLGTNQVSLGWGNPEQDPDRVFLSVEATRISVIYLRPAFDLLGKADERLPATFYRMLMSGVSGRILCYDEAEAARYLEFRMEDYAELAAAGEEGLEKPQSLEEAKGPWLSKALKPYARPQFPEIIQALRRGSRSRRIMEAAAELLVLSRRRKPHRPDWRVLEEYVSQSWYTLPFAILAFHENDIVCQAFASDEESWLQGGDEPCPAFFTIIWPGNPVSVKEAFKELRHFLSMLEAFGRLLSLCRAPICWR